MQALAVPSRTGPSIESLTDMTHLPMSLCCTRRRHPVLLLLSLTSAAAIAQEAPPTTTVERLNAVTVGLVKDPDILPYASMNDFLTQLQRVGEGLIRIDFKLTVKNAKPGSAAPKLALLTDERVLPIRPDAEGRFELPLLPGAEARNAELASNQSKGTLGLSGRMNLTVKPEQLDMAMVRRIMAVARRARGELLPWYLRWMFPQIEGVRICSDEPRWELEWRDAAQGGLLGIALSSDPKDRDPDAPKDQPGRPCTTLNGQEAWPDAARLLAPAGTSLSVRLAKP